MKISLDTNILIYFLEGIEPQASKVQKILERIMKDEDQAVISTITIAEILTGVYKSEDTTKPARVRKLLKDLTLNSFKIIPVTFEIADLAANLRSKLGGKLPDALIVATALNEKTDRLYSEDNDLQRYKQEIEITRI